MDNITIKRVINSKCSVCKSSDITANVHNISNKLYKLTLNHNAFVLCEVCLNTLSSIISQQSLDEADKIFVRQNGSLIQIVDLKDEEPAIYRLLVDIFENDNIYINSNVERNIEEVFRSLTTLESKILILFYAEQQNFEQIALLTDVSKTKVSESLYIIKNRLKSPRNKNILVNGVTVTNSYNPYKQMTVEEFNEKYVNSAALLNILRRTNINTVDDILSKSKKEIKKIRGLGNKRFSLLQNGLRKANLHLREEAS
ncbi:MAG: DNA-directed RNA polymerase subunit alpha C-terminal domain-containing protein [Ruminococcus sp.]|nr:DNA-directed RNA polymerase subunit alpha C-terminal domain-containing protein [Ruminococcus sp.]